MLSFLYYIVRLHYSLFIHKSLFFIIVGLTPNVLKAVPCQPFLYNTIIIIDSLLQYWEKAEFPFDAIPKLASLGVAGGTIKVLIFLTLP